MTEKTEIIPAKANMPAAQNITPMDMLQMAVQQNADLDKLEKLMALQERWEANEAKKAYTAAMAKFRSECPSIEKTKTVDFTSQKGRTHYTHSDLSYAADVLKKPLADNGFSYTWKTEQQSNKVFVTCFVTHKLGHSESTTLSADPDITGNKNSIQAIGSTVSYLERYTLFAILGLASKEMDDDGATAEPSALLTEAQVNELHDAAIEAEVLDNFMRWVKSTLKVDKLTEIRADKFKFVQDKLNLAIEARQKNGKQ